MAGLSVATPTFAAQQPTIWNGLPQASASFMRDVFHSPLKTVNGKMATLSGDTKPIYFLAGWCSWCAKTDQLLVSNHLMGKFQLVNVGLNGGERGTPLQPSKVTTVLQAEEKLQHDWEYYQIPWSVSNVDFAMPNSSMNSVVRSFPMILIPHAGHWYVQNGYSPNVGYWHQILA